MKWKKWLEDERIKKLFSRENLLVLVLAGILLFIIALPSGETGRKAEDTAEGKEENLKLSGTEREGENTFKTAEEEAGLSYVADMERRLTEVLEEMAEVGKVRVMITLKSSGELVVEKEMPVSRSMTTETVNTSQVGESVVYSTEGGSSTPYVVKTYVPEIEGVLVVAEGAGSGTVNRTVTEIVQALFSVEAHKIKVVKMETKTK